HGRRELAEGAPHEILGSLRAARVRGALDQLPRLLHEPSDGGRDALPAARLEVEARRQARGDGVVAERVVAAPAGARARVHRAAVPVVAGAGRAGGALGRHRRGGAAGRARGRRAARRARRGGHRRGQGAVAPAATRDVVAVRGAPVAGADAARAVGLGATGSAAVAPADAGRCAEVARLARLAGRARRTVLGGGARRIGIAGAVREVERRVAAARERAVVPAMVRRVAVAGALVALLAGIDEAVPARGAARHAGLAPPALSVRGARLRDRERAVRPRGGRAAVGRAGEATGRETERLARRPGEARRVALLVRPDQAVAAALGPALARVEGAVGATGERAAAEAEGDAGGAAEVRAVAVLTRLDAG